MRKLLCLVVFLLGLSVNVFATNTFSLKVEVYNLRNSKGVVQFAIYNKDGTIPDEKYKKYFKKQVAKIKNGLSYTLFENLPEGRYAINILHDEDQNGKVDKGFMLPNEGIGFSNYQSINMLNKPNFKKASFELNSNMGKIVKIIYF